MNAAYNATALIDVQYDPNYQSTGTVEPNFATGDVFIATTSLGYYSGVLRRTGPPRKTRFPPR